MILACEPAHFFGQERENKEGKKKGGGGGGRGEKKISLHGSHCIQSRHK